MNSHHQIAPLRNQKISRLLMCLSIGIFLLNIPWLIIDLAEATEYQPRTESNCTIGMSKGEKKTECHVPILHGCKVATYPGYDEPWAEASKGGATSCKFDEEQTDWKTSIVGTCQTCKTENCTGIFTVMFNCNENVPPANPALPQQK